MKARRKFRESKSHAVVWLVLVAVIAIGFIGFRATTSVFAVYNSWIADLPNLNSEAFNYAEDSYMYASDGTTLLAKFQLEKRDPVELKDINENAIKATVDVEDVRYYEHNGVDPQGIVRAVVNNLKGGSLEGASTITQQLVRNTALSEEATDITFKRKAREAELALEMEKRYTKDEILNMYLNTVNYGDGCYGIEAAAKNYFQVSAADLTLVQAATLAGIPQSPTAFNPKENPEACLQRRNLVLERMYTAGDITEEERAQAASEDLGLDPAPDEPEQGIYAYPYFTSFVRDQLMQPDNKYGCSYADLFEGGLKIYTTLDVGMQDIAETACGDQYYNMDEGMDAALVAMDPSNGYVKALVGGNDFYSDQWNIAVQGGRPTGSSFKAFTLAAAIESGISPQSTIDCSNPVTLPSGETVNNFGNANYGTRTIDDATAISSNTGYYRLTERIGVSKLIEMAHRLGVDAELAPYPIITLGTENVTPLEMAEAYSSFASGGIHHDYVIITRIEDKDGHILYEEDGEGERVLDESVASEVTRVLRGVFEKSYATAAGSGPSNGQPVAGKTGTGVDFRDHWLVGYSPTLTCAAWIGNRDYSSTSEYLTANSLWHNFMSMALADTPITPFDTTTTPTYTYYGTDTGTATTTNSAGSATGMTAVDAQVANDVSNYEAGSMTEGDVNALYPAYETNVTYQSSEEYPAGTVISESFDAETGVISIVVVQ
jgi:penicillin-binding protein 1A